MVAAAAWLLPLLARQSALDLEIERGVDRHCSRVGEHRVCRSMSTAQ